MKKVPSTRGRQQFEKYLSSLTRDKLIQRCLWWYDKTKQQTLIINEQWHSWVQKDALHDVFAKMINDQGEEIIRLKEKVQLLQGVSESVKKRSRL